PSSQWDQVDTCYDANGRQSFVSYPYQSTGFGATKRCSNTDGPGDTYAYDGMGRITRVTHSDNSYISTSYTGAAISVTDEGNGSYNLQRISQSDGLGRLAAVCEVSSGTLQGNNGTPAACNLDIAGTGFLTSYGYDLLGNLTSVTQGSVNRSFAYD